MCHYYNCYICNDDSSMLGMYSTMVAVAAVRVGREVSMPLVAVVKHISTKEVREQ